MIHYLGECRDISNALIPGAQVFVYRTGTATKASLFTSSGQEYSNPVTSDSLGLYDFYIDSGIYDISVVKPRVEFYNNRTARIQIGDSPRSALEYGNTVEAGVTAIQALETSTNSVAGALPIAISIPAGTHTLISPITITRHNVTLTVDGGARLIPPSNQAAIVFDGTSASDTYLNNWNLMLHGVIQGDGAGLSGQHGVSLKNVAHGTMWANAIRYVGGDGIRLDGAVGCWSNKFFWNQIDHVGGWGINMLGTGNVNACLYDGVIQTASLGGINARKAFGSRFHGVIEGLFVAVPALKLDSARNNVVSLWFEANAGDDILTAATDWACHGNVVKGPTYFQGEKSSPYYNINIAANTSNSFIIDEFVASFQTGRVIFVGTGNTTTTINERNQFNPATVTNNASTETKKYSTVNW